MDTQRIDERIFTFARICVEVNLSKGLLGRIKLKHKDRSWMQSLDHEIQRSGVEYVGKLDTSKMHVQNTKRTTAERRKPTINKRDGKSPIHIWMRRKNMKGKNRFHMKATKQKLRRLLHKSLWNHNPERIQIQWKLVEPKGSTHQTPLIQTRKTLDPMMKIHFNLFP